MSKMMIIHDPSRLIDDFNNNSRNTVESILQQYSAGERDFKDFRFPSINLRRANLKNINLQGADLRKADLREVNLSEANLSNACLDGANLQGAYLRNANLSNASLNKAVLNNANLDKACLEKANLKGAFLSDALMNEVNLKEACLEKANLNRTYLNKACLEKANLCKASLIKTYLIQASLVEANLCRAYFKEAFLYGACLKNAYYNDCTYFDKSFDPTQFGMRKKRIYTVKEFLNFINYLSDYSCHYLGRTLTISYLQSSCPKIIWFNQFQVTTSAKVIFSSNSSKSLNSFQLEYLQRWLNTFINNCSQIVKDFFKLIEKSVIFK